ncbi:MAG: HypC/HybG/HupF family hydrogenase formation chaperone [Candidatus Hodarchaeaceae archaeon]|nr:HypC/HybG/HupF family hydrogenase formation chaperone [Candidatus Hodarchaeaceae archaeon]
MCLAIPGKVLKIERQAATVDFGGVRREVRLDLLRDVREGDYVLVHVGYAIQTLDEEAAREILKSWEEVARGEVGA